VTAALSPTANVATSQATPVAVSPTAPASAPAAQPTIQPLPISFEVNQGQTDPHEQFVAHGNGYGLFLSGSEVTLVLNGSQAPASATSTPTVLDPELLPGTIATGLNNSATAVLRMQFVGANSPAQAVGVDRLPGTVNYLIGNDPSQWHTGIATYGKVDYQNLYPGIDLVYYGNQGQLEYDWRVAPGADPGLIRLAFQGADRVALDAQGNLTLDTAAGVMRQQAPVLYQDQGSVRHSIAGHFVVNADQSVSLTVGAYDHSQPLVIDPTLRYSTYLGGSASDMAKGVAIDGAGSAYITGIATSPNFPTDPPFQPNRSGSMDAFVSKFDTDGNLVYSTYLGGSGLEEGAGIAVDGAGSAYVTGFTTSTNFPTTPGAYQTTLAGKRNGYVTKLTPAGNTLGYSTYLGGSGSDQAMGIAVDGVGEATVVGTTSSTNFPTVQPLQSTLKGSSAAFVTRLNTAGSGLVYSTYLGGNGTSSAAGVAVDAAGNPCVTGSTTASNFPTANAVQATYGGGGDGFVTKLQYTQGAGLQLSYSTYLGGSGMDAGAGIAVDGTGHAYVTGYTSSANFPTFQAIQPTYQGGPVSHMDGFVTSLSPSGSFTYSTYLGGSGDDYGRGIAVDSAGDATVTGQTTSTNFPTVAPLQASNGGQQDAFVTKLNPSGSAYVYSSYLGGSSSDIGMGVGLDGAGNTYVGGYTYGNFPVTPGAFQGAIAGSMNAFVTKVATDPPPMPSSSEPAGLVQVAPGQAAPNVAFCAACQAPVNALTGATVVQTPTVKSDGQDPMDPELDWTNGANDPPQNGSGMFNTNQPYLLQVNGTATIVVVTGGFDANYFDQNGSGGYTPRFFSQDQLSHNSSTGEFVYTDTLGDTIHFNDFSPSLAVNQRGSFNSFVDPAGNVTRVTARTPNGQIAEVQRSTTVNGTTTTESFLYTFVAGGVNAGLVASLTLRRSTDGGNSWSTVRQASYGYYDGSQSYGNAGDLATVTILDANNNVLDTTYFRYYTPADAGATGYAHGLKYYFTPQSYARLVTAVGNPTTATDAQVAPYADDFFQYDSRHRVTEEVVQGTGCSSCSGGLGTYAFSYVQSSNPAGFNSWREKTTVTLPDGNQDIYYVNAYGQQMLLVYHDVTSGQNWESFTAYDSQGRAILDANPSAVTGFDDSKPDLLNNQGGTYQYLSNNSGLITLTDYYTTTTATETTSGSVAGYKQDTKLEQGQQGTPILQQTWQYYTHSANGITVHPMATNTTYRNADGTGAETTSFRYTWFAGTVQMQSMTTTLPVISAAQNGPGVADQEESVFDSYGREVWHLDADGYISNTAYDPATGAVVESITDVNTADTSEFSGLPAGWSTPPGGGLNLVTIDQVDSLGRPVKETDPNGNISYLVYDDPDHEYRVYPGWNVATGMPTGPTEVFREDRPGGYTEILTMSAAPHLTGGVPDGTEAIGNVQTLARSYTNAAGQVVRTDAYFNLSGVSYSTALYLGTANVNYYTTLYGYDHRGREDRVQSPTGTITRTVYDGLSRVVSTWVGTNDTPASGFWSPSNPAGMVQLTADVYDNGGVGDSNLTQMTQFPGGSAAPRVCQYFFDWRDREVASKCGVMVSENDGTHRPIVYTTYDNLDEAVLVQQFDGDGVAINTLNGVPQPPSASLLRAQIVYSYDDQGRVFREQVYDVNPATGAVSSTALTTNDYYDHRGNQIAQSDPGGLWTKDVYDGAGRMTVEYTADGGGGTTWVAAASVANDVVLEQVEMVYDSNDNTIETIDRQRFHNATGTGALGGPASTSAPQARVYFTGSYYDAADRLTATVDVGTNGGTTWVRRATEPARTDTALVTDYSYNAAGWVQDETDPRGIDTRTLYDNLGRTTTSITDYTTGTPTNTSDYTTAYTYDGDNHVLTVQAVMPAGTPSQTTQYVYGVTRTTGSGLDSNDQLAATIYPDPATGQPSTSPSQRESYTYNALGQVASMTDRNGTTHQFSYDVLGRPISDAVTVLGAGVDGTVRRLDTAYDTQGNPYLYTSYADTAGTTIVNQVEQTYNGLGQLTGEYQSHAGPVVIGTTPVVQYTYSELANGANHSRPISITYPNGRVVDLNYNTGLDDGISRLSSISDVSGVLEAYTYMGLSTVVQRAHPQNGVNLTYFSPTAATGDAGDQYTGLDRFGRVVDQLWLNPNTATATDEFQYTYDRDGNVLTRSNLVNPAFNEQYTYDNNNQLTSFARGAHTQTWSYDAQGNWNSVTTDGMTQTRVANAQNQYTSVSGAPSPAYDRNGSLTTDPNGNTYVYDAWNRLVAVKSGSTTLATYSYDALGRRITENTGTASDLYYNSEWQVIEERASGSNRATIQYIWSPLLSDTLVERDRDPNGSGTLSERLYVQQDANGNVTALINTTGNVVERYVYDPFGAATILTANWNTGGGGSFGWRYLFQGLRFDMMSGLYWGRNRDYSPSLGRWLQTDPIRFAAGQNNFYAFVGNNPGTRSDPLGLGWNWRSFAVGALKAVAVAATVALVVTVASIAAPVAVAAIAASTTFLIAASVVTAVGVVATANQTYQAVYQEDIFGNRLTDEERSEAAGEALVGWVTFAWSGPKLFKAWRTPRRLNVGGMNRVPPGQEGMRPARPGDFTINPKTATEPNIKADFNTVKLPKNTFPEAIIERVPWKNIRPQGIENVGGAVKPGGRLTIETAPLTKGGLDTTTALAYLRAMRNAGFKNARLLPRQSQGHPSVFQGTKPGGPPSYLVPIIPSELDWGGQLLDWLFGPSPGPQATAPEEVGQNDTCSTSDSMYSGS
jgi:RHS repeat-associated protein